MRAIAPLLLAGLLVTPAAADPKITVARDTTYVTGPLDKDGYVDYAAALNERLGKGVTPDTNANVLICKAVGPKLDDRPVPADFFKLMGMAVPPEAGSYFVDLRAFAGLTSDEANNLTHPAGRRPWAAKERPALADWLKANEKPLTLAVEASQRSRYFAPVVLARSDSGRPDPLIAGLARGAWNGRALANALVCRAMLRVAEGRGDAAWEDLLACHRLGRLVAQGGSVIEFVAGISLDRLATEAVVSTLADPRLTSEQLVRYGRAMRRLPPFPPLADTIEFGSRLLYLDALQFIRRGGGGLGGKPDPKAQQALARLDYEPAMRHGNLCYDRLAAALRLPERAARVKELAQFEEDFKAWGKQAREAGEVENLLNDPDKALTVVRVIGIVTLGETLPAVARIQESAERLEQAHRNLHVAFALAAYQRDHNVFPKALADLSPKYLDKVPDDLFTGKPLVYRPADGGFLLYSLGPNGKDDEGRTAAEPQPGDDIAVRLPLAPARK